jgi:hypothetical protein
MAGLHTGSMKPFGHTRSNCDLSAPALGRELSVPLVLMLDPSSPIVIVLSSSTVIVVVELSSSLLELALCAAAFVSLPLLAGLLLKVVKYTAPSGAA